MKPLTPLSVAFAVLAALVVWHEVARDSTHSLVEEAALVPIRTRDFVADDVGKIEVTAPGGSAPAYTLERDGKSWRAVSAFKAPASGANVNKLLEALTKAEGELRTDDGAVLEQFDLSKPRAVDLRVLDKEGKDLVHVGIGRTSGRRGAFVRNLAAEDSKTYALSADVRGLLGLPMTSTGAHEPDKPDVGYFHSKDFPQFNLDSAVKVELTAPGRSATFERSKADDKGKRTDWRVTAGGPDAPLKKEGVEKAVASLGGALAATALVDPAKKKELGFDAPRYRIAVTSEDGTTRAAVGSTDAACEHFYVHLDAEEPLEVLYEASEQQFHTMFPMGPALFDIKLPEVKDADLGTIDVLAFKDGDGRSIRMERKGTKPTDDWTLTTPSWPIVARQSSLRGIASALKTIRVLDYVDPGIDTGKPIVSLRWAAPGAEPDASHLLQIGDKAPAGKDRLFTMFPAKHAWVMPESTVERLAPETLSLIEPKLFHGWTEGDVKSVRVEGASPDWKPEWSLVRDGDGWSLSHGDEKKPADKKAVDAFLTKLLAVEVKTLRDGKDGAAMDGRMWIDNAKGEPVALQVLPLDKDKRWVRAGGLEFEVEEKEFVPPAASFEPKPEPTPEPTPPK